MWPRSGEPGLYWPRIEKLLQHFGRLWPGGGYLTFPRGPSHRRTPSTTCTTRNTRTKGLDAPAHPRTRTKREPRTAFKDAPAARALTRTPDKPTTRTHHTPARVPPHAHPPHARPTRLPSERPTPPRASLRGSRGRGRRPCRARGRQGRRSRRRQRPRRHEPPRREPSGHACRGSPGA